MQKLSTALFGFTDNLHERALALENRVAFIEQALEDLWGGCAEMGDNDLREAIDAILKGAMPAPQPSEARWIGFDEADPKVGDWIEIRTVVSQMQTTHDAPYPSTHWRPAEQPPE